MFDAGHEDHELVAAHADDHVGGSNCVEETPGDGEKDLVSEFVAEGVVDVFEAIEIDDGQGDLQIVTSGKGERPDNLFLKESAVGESGQRVVQSEMADGELGFLLGADVLRDDEEAMVVLVVRIAIRAAR
jgi:hypothetical protein